MKKILGLDLGTTSIGWAYVHEAEKESEESKIVKLGVRVVPLTTDENKNFTEGKSITTNSSRTLKRQARRNKDRYKMRRQLLKNVLIEEGWITKDSKLDESFADSTHNTYKLRAEAAESKISLKDLGKVLLMINKKRGYKSNRKAKNEDETGSIISEMDIAIKLNEESISPSEYALRLLSDGKKEIPVFYRSDLLSEFDSIWNKNKNKFSEILTPEFKDQIKGRAQKVTTKIFYAKYKINTVKLVSKNKKIEEYQHRVDAYKSDVDIAVVAFALASINGSISNSSGYLGAIGDRSKILHMRKITVGQYLYNRLKENPHINIKNSIFYRQDYIDEFERIWKTQSSFYTQLNAELKEKIRDKIIFYQRKLKSQKGLISFCEFESSTKEVIYNGKKMEKQIGARVIPRSSPLFQEFKIWSLLENVIVTNIESKKTTKLDLDAKMLLHKHLSVRQKLSANQVLKILFNKNAKNWKINYTEVEGNKTQSLLISAFEKMLFLEGNDMNFSKMEPDDILDTLTSYFKSIGVNTDILKFNDTLKKHELVKQPAYLLWHLLYSFEGDESRTGTDSLLAKLSSKFGFSKQHSRILVSIDFLDDYGSLSAKAIRKILPFLKENEYSIACSYAGYNHSALSLSKEENSKRILSEKLDLVKRNSLRNPVVEKILNQMINVVNFILDDPDMGKPDEIRIELARNLKKSKSERESLTKHIKTATKVHDDIRKVLKLSPFNIKSPSRNDVIRYKLYQELAFNGYKDIYTNEPIKSYDLFSNKFDIEHIIPKAICFDDSFSNKTLCPRDFNARVKGSQTAYDCIANNRSDSLGDYVNRVEDAYNSGISKAKYQKLLKKREDIGEGFIERDLRNTQYISRQTRLILLKICRHVQSTTGKITDRLRSDWDLINVMRELNFKKYKAAGLTETIERKDQKIERIKDWSKRNDHRHHAMDALVVAFTKVEHVQVLNNLHAKSDRSQKFFKMYDKITITQNRKTVFIKPLEGFRAIAKKHLESILISIKAKNKVVTTNINKIKVKGGYKNQTTMTPRGQLHEETIYGLSKFYDTKFEKIGSKFDEKKIATVAKKSYRNALFERLKEYGSDPRKAFTGKNSLSKNPVNLNDGRLVPEKVKTVMLRGQYTISKPINKDLKLDKIIDKKIKKKLIEYKTQSDNPKEAFSNLELNPIWLDNDKTKSLKRVKITGVRNAISIHSKISDVRVNKGVDFVSPGNNHHVAIYKDDKGKLQEDVVSLFKAVTRKRLSFPIVDKLYKEEDGWTFLFTLKQNEMFIIPKDGFEVSSIDILDPKNKLLISPYLFRVQKISTKNYFFNHHLNTMAITGDDLKYKKSLKGITYYNFQSLEKLKNIFKVRIDHLGDIVQVGEF